LANVGIGKFNEKGNEKGNAETLSEAKETYKRIAELAKEHGITISLITIKNLTGE